MTIDPATLTHPHLQHLMETLNDTTTEAVRIRTAYTPAQLAWKPDPAAWNMLECFDHLRVVDDQYHPAVEAALERAPARKADQPYRPGLFSRAFIWFVSPRAKMKVKTLRTFEPTPALTDVAALDRFIAHQDQLAALIQRADGVNLNATKLTSPASKFVRFTIGEALTMLVTHQRRHLGQALRLTSRDGFPEA